MYRLILRLEMYKLQVYDDHHQHTILLPKIKLNSINKYVLNKDKKYYIIFNLSVLLFDV